MIPHSFSVLNFAICDSKRLASAANHGCQMLIWRPRSASLSTFKLLAAGAGVSVADAFPAGVPLGCGVVVLEVKGVGGAQAERMNRLERKAAQALRQRDISRLPAE